MSSHCYLIETFIFLLELSVGKTVVSLVPCPAHPVGLPGHIQVVITGGLSHNCTLRGGRVAFTGHSLLPVMDQLSETEL